MREHERPLGEGELGPSEPDVAELERRYAEGTEGDARRDRRMLWRELAVLVLVALLMLARELWLT